MIEYNEKVPLYSQIATKLEELITNGAFPESKLPTERELSLLFKVSVITIKKSLEVLLGKDLIYRRPRHGTFIKRQSNGSSQSVTNHTITWLKILDLNYPESHEIDTSICKRFEVEHPGWQIQIKEATKLDLLTSSLKDEISNADLYTMDRATLDQYITQSKLAPLNNTVSFDIVDHYFPAALQPAVLDQQIYALPRNLNTTCLFFNKTIFEESGVNLPDRTVSWDELATTLNQLPAERHNQKLYLFAYATYAARFWENIIWQNGGQVFDGETCTIDSQVCIDSIKQLTHFLHSMTLDRTYDMSRDPLTFFNTNHGCNLACFLGSPRFHVLLKKQQGDQWVTAPIATAKKQITGSNVFYVGMNQHTAAKEAALKALNLICGEFGQDQLGTSQTSYPALISSAEKTFGQSSEKINMSGFNKAAHSAIHLTEKWHYDNFKFYLLQENIRNCISNPDEIEATCRNTAGIINNLSPNNTPQGVFL